MNTKDKWETTATIHDEHRRAVWGPIFPDARVPIKSILPFKADLPGHPKADVYMLDLDAITDEQREKLIDTIVGLFGESAQEVRSDIDERGCPILADDVTVSSSDQGLVFSLMDDDDLLNKRDPDDDLYDGEDEDSKICGSCGEMNKESNSFCWNCEAEI